MARLRTGPVQPAPSGTALDVGCGAGASTAAACWLRRPGDRHRSVRADGGSRASRSAGGAVRGRVGEGLPVAADSVGLIGAAGSLNYAALGPFLAEADRVLGTGGSIAISNYAFGTPEAEAAPGWPETFVTRWPRPASAPVTASSFASGPFRVVVDDRFTVTLTMTLDAYLAYLMTETSVARAVAGGTPVADIRAWCRATLAPGFTAARPITFACSLLVLQR